MNVPRILKFLYYAFIAGTLMASFVYAGAGSSISGSLCGIVGSVRTVIGVLSLLLFIAGGVLYAGAHMLPAAGNLRGNLQGWSMGMIVGSVVGLILVILAPTILTMIAGLGGNSVTIASGC
jgi:hypothetical protein